MILLFCGIAWALPLDLDFSEDSGPIVGGGDPGQWEWGVVADGPESGWNGPTAWSTRLDLPYMHEADDWLELPAVDLTGTERPVLGITHWYAIVEGDLGNVEVLLDDSWIPIQPVYGYPTPADYLGEDGFLGESDGWRTDWFELDPNWGNVQLRLRFRSDAALADDGWLIGRVQVLDGDPIPPDIRDVVGPADTSDLDGPHAILAQIVDDRALDWAKVVWYADGVAAGEIPLTRITGDLWGATLPFIPPGTAIAWWIEASDGTNRAVSPTEGFRVFLPAPPSILCPSGRIWSTHARLEWSIPTTEHPIQAYRIRRDGVPLLTASSPLAVVPLAGPLDTFGVSAVFDTPFGIFEGDQGTPCTVTASVPRVDNLSPAWAWQGDRLRLQLTGENLLLAQDDAALELGPGLEVESIRVEHVDRLSAEIRVDRRAVVGPRTAWLRSGDQIIWIEDLFSVREGTDRPRVLTMHPTEIVRSEPTTLHLRLSAPLEGGRLDFDPGEGLVVTATRARTRADGELSIEVDLLALPDAELGPRRPVLDDGVRLTATPTLRVITPVPPTTRVCASGAQSPSVLALLTTLLVLVGFRRNQSQSKRPFNQ